MPGPMPMPVPKRRLDEAGGEILGGGGNAKAQQVPKIGMPPSGTAMMPTPMPQLGAPEDLTDPMASLNPQNVHIYLGLAPRRLSGL